MIVGRAAELAALRRLLGRGAVVTVTGEPGIGKSSVLDALREDGYERGHLVLGTVGVEQETALPYAGLDRMLRPILAGLDELGALERGALSSALGLGAAVAAEPMLVALSALELLSHHADRVPVLIVVDDLQWVDAATRAVLVFLGRRLVTERIVLVAAMRDGYDVAPIGEECLELRGLDRDAAGVLLDRRDAALSREVRERLLAVAAGNPLALIELPTSAGDDAIPISARVEHAFASRLDDLPAATRGALLIAAADAASSVAEILAACASLGVVASRADLAPAVAARLLEPDALGFRHPLVRSAIYQRAPLEDRLAAHAALSAVVGDADRRAWHAAAATIHRDDEVAQALEHVALRAQARGAMLEATLALGRAAELTERPGLRVQRRLRAGELAFEAGRADLVRDAVEEVQRLTLDVRDRARAGLLSEIFHDGVVGDVERVRRLVEDAGEVAALGDVDLALELLRGAAVRCWWAAMSEAVRLGVLSAAERLDVSPCDPRRLAVVGCVAPLERGAEVAARVPDALALAGEDPVARWSVAMAAHAVGAHEWSCALLRELAPTLRRHGRFGLLTQVLSMLQWDAVMLGAWEVAQAVAQEGDRLAADTGQPIWGAGLTCGLSAAAAVRGEHDVADTLAAAAERVIVPQRLADMHSVLLTTRGIAAGSAGRHDDAIAVLTRAFDREDPAYHYREQFGALVPLAEAAAARGDRHARAIVLRAASAVGPGAAPDLQRRAAFARALVDDAA